MKCINDVVGCRVISHKPLKYSLRHLASAYIEAMCKSNLVLDFVGVSSDFALWASHQK